MALIADVKEGDLDVTSDGLRTTRTFFVTGLAGAAHARLYNASITSGVPRRGEPHPSIPLIYVTDVKVSVDEVGAKVAVTYAQPTYQQREPNETEKPTIQVGSTVQESTTSKDKDNKLIKVNFSYKPVDEDGNQGALVTDEYVPVLSIQVGQAAIEYQRQESNNPLPKAIKYVGKVNSILIGGFAARTLLCTGIEGQSNDGGVTYSVSYRFQYNPKTWDAEFYYIDTESGQPHKDVTINPANGYGIAKIYIEIDFSALNVI